MDRKQKLHSLIFFAWLAEGTGALLGLINSVSITFGSRWPTDWTMWVLVLPAATLAVFELARILLVKAACHPGLNKAIRAIALVTTICLIGITFENWTFGIERMLNYRLADITSAREAVSTAEKQKAIADQAVKDFDSRVQTSYDQAREKQDKDRVALTKAVLDGQTRIDGITAQIKEENAANKAKNDDILQYCGKGAGPCGTPRYLAEDQRHNEVMTRLGREQAEAQTQWRDSSDKLRSLTDVSPVDKSGLTDLQSAVIQAQDRVEVAKNHLRQEAHDSPVFRVGVAVFGGAPENLTDEQVGMIRTVFSVYGASIISILGTALALVYYWPHSSGQMSRMFRGMMIRMRRRLTRIETVQHVVEVEVPNSVRLVEELDEAMTRAETAESRLVEVDSEAATKIAAAEKRAQDTVQATTEQIDRVTRKVQWDEEQRQHELVMAREETERLRVELDKTKTRMAELEIPEQVVHTKTIVKFVPYTGLGAVPAPEEHVTVTRGPEAIKMIDAESPLKVVK